MSIYDTENSVQQSFDESSLPAEQLQTQQAELTALKKIIIEVSAKKRQPIYILDIGMGEGRIVKQLHADKKIWGSIATYQGIDNADPCIAIANKAIKELKLEDKVSVRLLEADNINSLIEKYDLIITTWFTAGNFCPSNFPFETYGTTSYRIDLTENKRFENIFSSAYNLLNSGGEIVIGSCYIDNEITRKKQEAFYQQLGMNVITNAEDSFTATREKFWSQRFTTNKLLHYLHFVAPEKIIFTVLDNSNFAMQVRIKK